MATSRYNLPTIVDTMTADVTRDLNALAEAVDEVLADEFANLSSRAVDISVTDQGGYFPTKNVEAALQTIGQTLNGARGSLISSAQQLGVM